MSIFDYDIGILGGGAAGLTVAAGTSQLGAKTILMENESRLGGDCLHYGCVPSKTLIKSAKVYHMMRHPEKYGLPKAHIPPVDFKDVAARIQKVIGVIQKHDSEERFCSLGTKVEFGEPEFIDEHQVRINGKTVSAKNWVVSTGSSPGAPPINGLDRTDFITNKEIFSLDELPKAMIVLGGGPIAVEMAQAFCRLGTKVTVIQRSDQILSKEDRDMADGIRTILEEEGVTIHTGTSVQYVQTNGREQEVVFEKDGQTLSVKGDKLLVALGRRANVDSLKLENAGVEYSRKGIAVDERMRSNQKHIYVAGDTTGRHQFTHAAGYEGGIVVTNIMFKLPRKADYTFLPAATYCEPELAGMGMNETAAKKAGVEYKVWEEDFAQNDRALAESASTGKLKLVLDKKNNPLGVQILGPQAGNLLSEWVAVLGGKVKLSTLAGAVHPYPTLGEINKRVAGDVFSEKIFSDKVRKTLKFFFGFKGRACGAASDQD